MEIKQYITGIQHIGIPTADLSRSKAFYEALGFFCVHENRVAEKNQSVAFLRLGNLTLELYEDPVNPEAGAVNHFALNCTDIRAAFAAAKQAGLEILSNGVEELPFWAHGVGFFIVRGPSGERVEFCQQY